MRIKYAGPFAAVELPTLGLVLEQGEEFDVDDDAGKNLLDQRDAYAPVSADAKEYVAALDSAAEAAAAVDEARTPEDLRADLNKQLKPEIEAVANGLGIDVESKTKAEIVDEIVAATFPTSGSNENEES